MSCIGQWSIGSSINSALSLITEELQVLPGKLGSFWATSTNSELPNMLFITSEKQPWYFQCLLVLKVNAFVINELTEHAAICCHRLCKKKYDRLCSCAYPSVLGNPHTVQPAWEEAEGRMGRSRSVKIILPLKNNHHRGLQIEVQRAEEDYGVLSGTWWENMKGVVMLAIKQETCSRSLPSPKQKHWSILAKHLLQALHQLAMVRPQHGLVCSPVKYGPSEHKITAPYCTPLQPSIHHG